MRPQTVLATPISAEGAFLTDAPELGGTAHSPDRLIDGDTSTDWSEGAVGLGSGSAVTFTFNPEVDLRLMCVVNGYAVSRDLYELNAKARQLTVDSRSSSTSATLKQAGSQDPLAWFQDVRPPQGRTTTVTITLVSSYAGLETAGQPSYQDTAISEIQFWAMPDS